MSDLGQATPAGRRRGLASLRRTWGLIRPFCTGSGRYLLTLSASSLVAGFVEAGVLYVVVQAATLIAGGEDSTALRLGPLALDEVELADLLGVALALVVALGFMALVASVSSARLVTGVVNRTRKRAFAAFAGASWSEQAKEPEGHLQAVLSGHIQQCGLGVLRAANALTAVLSFLAYFVSALVVDPVAAGGVLVGVSLVGVVLLPLSRATRRLSNSNLRATDEHAQLVTQYARLARDVQTFGVADEVRLVADRSADEAERIQLRSRVLAKLTPQIYQCTALLIVVGGLGALSAVEGREVGQLGAIVLLVVRALSYGQTVSASLQGMVETEPYIRTLVRSERAYAAAALVRGDEVLGPLRGLDFRHVSFGYDRSRSVLHDVGFTVAPGESSGSSAPRAAASRPWCSSSCACTTPPRAPTR